MKKNKNIIITQIIGEDSSFYFKELIPFYNSGQQVLTFDGNTVKWDNPFILDTSIIINNNLKDTSIYIKDNRIGIGRLPLHNYKIDVAIPQNTLMTAFHIGDGSYGFSFGNGTREGFVPEIIGIGSNENDSGMYIIGIAGNNKTSNIPLIVFDGRNMYGKKITNRPILGITSADYNNYSIYVDSLENLHVKNNIYVSNIFLNNKSLINIINNLQQQINELKNKFL